MRFCLVSEDSVPEETVTLLRDACEDRRILFEVVTAKVFDYDPLKRLKPGDLLYRAATAVAASRVEQFLYAPGVATFYVAKDGVHSSINTQALVAEAAGIPMPKTTYVASTKVALLQQLVDRVGGFPVVVKVLGRSSGIGVMMAESMVSLRPLVDFTIAQGHNPLLCQFIRDAVHWRVIVLGGHAIASYRNKQAPSDFRSFGSKDRADFDARPGAAISETAVRAAVTFGLEFAGVDVLEDPTGNAWFLEANFPCYYPQAQLYGGVDIAGAMVDFLAAKVGHVCSPPEIRRVANVPDMFVIDGFASVHECDHVLAKADRIEAEKTPGIVTRRDSTGFSFEMPIQGDGVLAGLVRRINRAVGMENDLASTFRFRRYAAGESHRAHLDQYEIEGCLLVATAILYLTDTESGGETQFPHAMPEPVRIAPQRGRLAVWFNYRRGGAIEPAALHKSLAVERGVKATIGFFIYKRVEDCDERRAALPVLMTRLV
jgi:hypothetical protein